MGGIAPPFTGWKPVVILLYYTRKWEVGFLYYQQETGITTVVNFTSLPETRLVSRFTFRCSTTCVSSPYPAICQKDYSVTPVSRASPRQIYYNGSGFTCQPPILTHLLGLVRQKLPASFLVVINISYEIEYRLVNPRYSFTSWCKDEGKIKSLFCFAL